MYKLIRLVGRLSKFRKSFKGSPLPQDPNESGKNNLFTNSFNKKSFQSSPRMQYEPNNQKKQHLKSNNRLFQSIPQQCGKLFLKNDAVQQKIIQKRDQSPEKDKSYQKQETSKKQQLKRQKKVGSQKQETSKKQQPKSQKKAGSLNQETSKNELFKRQKKAGSQKIETSKKQQLKSQKKAVSLNQETSKNELFKRQRKAGSLDKEKQSSQRAVKLFKVNEKSESFFLKAKWFNNNEMTLQAECIKAIDLPDFTQQKYLKIIEGAVNRFGYVGIGKLQQRLYLHRCHQSAKCIIHALKICRPQKTSVNYEQMFRISQLIGSLNQTVFLKDLFYALADIRILNKSSFSTQNFNFMVQLISQNIDQIQKLPKVLLSLQDQDWITRLTSIAQKAYLQSKNKPSIQSFLIDFSTASKSQLESLARLTNLYDFQAILISIYQKYSKYPLIVREMGRLILKSEAQSYTDSIRKITSDSGKDIYLPIRLAALVKDKDLESAMGLFKQSFKKLFIESTKQRFKLLMQLDPDALKRNVQIKQLLAILLNDDFMLQIYQKYDSHNSFYESLIDQTDLMSHWKKCDNNLRFHQLTKGQGPAKSIRANQSFVRVFEKYSKIKNLEEIFEERIKFQNKRIKKTCLNKLKLLAIIRKIMPRGMFDNNILSYYLEINYHSLQLQEKAFLARYGIFLNFSRPADLLDHSIWVIENNLRKFPASSHAFNQFIDMRLQPESLRSELRKTYNQFVQKNYDLIVYLRQGDPKTVQYCQEIFKPHLNNILRHQLEAWHAIEGMTKVNGYQNVIQYMFILAVQLREPMLVYMAEKIAYLSGTVIDHSIAVAVSQLMNLNVVQQQEFYERAKNSLKYIGGVDRQKIYDPRQDYKHVLTKDELNRHMNYLLKRGQSQMSRGAMAVLAKDTVLMGTR